MVNGILLKHLVVGSRKGTVSIFMVALIRLRVLNFLLRWGVITLFLRRLWVTLINRPLKALRLIFMHGLTVSRRVLRTRVVLLSPFMMLFFILALVSDKFLRHLRVRSWLITALILLSVALIGGLLEVLIVLHILILRFRNTLFTRVLTCGLTVRHMSRRLFFRLLCRR